MPIQPPLPLPLLLLLLTDFCAAWEDSKLHRDADARCHTDIHALEHGYPRVGFIEHEALTASDLRIAAASNSSGHLGSFVRLDNQLYSGTKSPLHLPGFRARDGIAAMRWDFEVVVTRNLTIRAHSSFDRTRVVGSGATRLLRVARGVHVTICNVDFSQATNGSDGPSALGSGGGGAFRVMSGGSLTMVNSTVSGFGSANGTGGGAVYVEARGGLTLTGCSLARNSARGGDGGAVFLEAGAFASLLSCSLANNSAPFGTGGAISSDGGRLALRNSSLRGNRALASGAMHVSTRAGQTAPRPEPERSVLSSGALLLQIENCSFYDNRAVWGADTLGIAPPAQRPQRTQTTMVDREFLLQNAAATIASSSFDGSRTDGTASRRGHSAIVTSYAIDWLCDPLGYYTPRRATYPHGFIACVDACPPGTFAASSDLIDASGPRGCADCPRGHFCDAPGMAMPAACPAGSYSASLRATDNSTCVTCPPGTASARPGNGNGTCDACADGLVSPSNSSACFLPRTPAAKLLVGTAALMSLALVAFLAILTRAGGVLPFRRAVKRAPHGGAAAHRTYATTELGGWLPTAFGRAAPRELLCVACSPKRLRLAKASVEIVQVAEASAWSQEQVTLSWGGQAETIIADLSQRPTRRLLFAGHADAPSVNGGRSLGFTSPGGDLAPFDEDKLVQLLAQFFPRSEEDSEHPHRILKLIFLNGCQSEPLGRRLRELGAPCVVCWRTATNDDLARLFAVKFFHVIATCERAAEESSLHPSVAYIRAFDEAVAAVCAARTWHSRGRPPMNGRTQVEHSGVSDAVPKHATTTDADGETVQPSSARATDAIPVPVLLCEGDGANDEGTDIVRFRQLPASLRLDTLLVDRLRSFRKAHPLSSFDDIFSRIRTRWSPLHA